MDYFEPKSINEALSLLAKYDSGAKVIAGGTDVMVDIKYKEEPGCLVNIKRIPGISGIRENGGELGIGPLVTIREIEASELIRNRLPVLWEAAHQFASLQIRNTATIGGNVCRASPSGETLAPLLVLEAKARLAFLDREETQEINSLFLGPGATTLGTKGLLTEIEIPYPPKGSRGVYLKQAVRGPMDIAMVGVAVLVVPNAANTELEEVRIGLGAVAPTPIRAVKAETMLRSKPLTTELLHEAARLASSESSPITDQRGSAEYRRWIVEALTRRGIKKSWEAATGKEMI